MKRRFLALVALVALVGIVAPTVSATLLTSDTPREEEPDAPDASSEVYLSDLRWMAATTGWVALADNNLPRLDASFLNSPISVSGQSYDKGLGTFPLSEISYSLDGT